MMFEKEKIQKAIIETTEILELNEVLSNKKLLEICNRHAFESIAKGTDGHLTHEVLEVAVNLFVSQKYGSDVFSRNCENSKILDELESLEKRIPVQSWRSGEQLQLQQFGTPPTVAYLMTKMLNPVNLDTILEPSAGTGSLATWLRMSGCNLYLNELSERRRTLLELQGYQPTAFNAEFFNDFLSDEISPTGVLMNPPFSASAGRSKKGDSNFGFRHINSALARLKKGGRLVGLLGTDALTKTDKGAVFLNTIADDYCLKAVINLPKNAFYKYGTTFGTTIICIEKTEEKQPLKKSTIKDLIVSCRSLEEVLFYTDIFD